MYDIAALCQNFPKSKRVTLSKCFNLYMGMSQQLHSGFYRFLEAACMIRLTSKIFILQLQFIFILILHIINIMKFEFSLLVYVIEYYCFKPYVSFCFYFITKHPTKVQFFLHHKLFIPSFFTRLFKGFINLGNLHGNNLSGRCKTASLVYFLL